jgi:hypothetical protein
LTSVDVRFCGSGRSRREHSTDVGDRGRTAKTGNAASSRFPDTSTLEAAVGTLRVDLQGGFDRDVVEIWVDEEPRWRREGVTTKFTLALAESVPLEVPDGSADVRIVLPAKELEQAMEALVAGDTYVVVRLEDDRLVVEQLAQAPYDV